MINFEAKLPFRVHVGQVAEANVQKHIYHFRKEAAGYCPFKLYAPHNKFLPFQVFIPVGEGATLYDTVINEVRIYNCYGNFIADMTSDFPSLAPQLVVHTEYGVGVWIVYDGVPAIGGLLLDPGYYYFQIETDNTRSIYSELFYVPCTVDYNKMLKIEFWNSCDFANVIYQYGYKNYIYFDTSLLRNEPAVEETGFENGYGEFQLTSSRFIDRYKFNYLVPQYLVDAFLFMKMHDNIYFRIPDAMQTGKMRIDKIAQGWDIDGVLCELNVDLEQEQRLFKGACCENKIFSGLVPVAAVPDEYDLNVDLYDVLTTVANVNLLTNDLGYLIVMHPAFVGFHTTTEGGTVQIFANGKIKYEKPLIYQAPNSAPYIDTFIYKIKDFYGQESSAIETLNFDFIQAVADTINVSGATETHNLLENDFIPVEYNFMPPIYDEGLPVVAQKITHLSGNPSCPNNYIEIDIYTGVATYYNIDNITSPMIVDVYFYRIFVAIGVVGTSVQISVHFS